MKKWYVITGVLALLSVISLGAWFSNAGWVDELRGEVDELKGELSDAQSFVKDKELLLAHLSDVQSELTAKANELSDAQKDLDRVASQLARLKATKEIDFGNGLRLFDLDAGDYWVEGKVQNVSDSPMEEVVIFVAFYELDGTFAGVIRDSVQNLYPEEVAEWRERSSFYASWSGKPGLFDVYAIGNKR